MTMATQPKLACYKQTSKSLPGTSQPRRVKATIDRIYTRQFKYVNPFTAELFFKAWHVSGNLVLQINLTVKYLETIYENVPHALRNSATYHN